MAGDERKDKGWKISHILLKHLSVQHIRQKEQTQTNRLKQLNIKMALEGSAAASFHSQDQSLCQTTSLRHKQGWTLLFHGTERSLLERRCSAKWKSRAQGCCTCQTHLCWSQVSVLEGKKKPQKNKLPAQKGKISNFVSASSSLKHKLIGSR